MTQTIDLSRFTTRQADGTARMELAVEGIACGGCINRIETGLKTLPQVTEARVNFSNRRLSVTWRDGALDPADVVARLEQMGYCAHPFQPAAAEERERSQSQGLLRCLAVAGFAGMNIMLLSVSVWSGNGTDMTAETRDFFHWASALIALPAAAYAGRPFFRSALAALRARSVNMDVPISLGVLLALGMSLVETANHATHAYFDSAVMLLFFLLCGRYLGQALRRRTRAVAGNLAALRAETAHRLEPSGELVQVPAAGLKPGDCILVRPGERIPADGAVFAGRSEIDEGLVTGETAPRVVAADAQVYAGCMNLSGALTMRVTASGENTFLDEVERLLDKVVKAKSRYVRLADRAARYYAPMVHTAAAVTLIGWLMAGASVHDAILTAISVLIITCPCALALAIPSVQVVTAGRLFRAGIFLNSGDAIERFAEIDTVVFDKTGTLTLPEPRVTNAAGTEPDLLEKAARLALTSRHPLAAAVARHARDRKPWHGAIEESGQGVRAVVDGVEMRLGSTNFCGIPEADTAGDADRRVGSLIAFRWGERQTLFTVQQSLRADATVVVDALMRRGLAVHVLSGDRPEAVAPVASALRVADWQGGLKPAAKVAAIEAMKASGRRVLMVGDGINDAPALAAAHVSLSPISAADLSQAQADAVFLGERLAPVLETILSARHARRLMHQNLWLAAIYNAIAVPIAIVGLVTPVIAAAAMSGSSMLVSLNALRPRRTRDHFADQASAPAQRAAESRPVLAS
jgi:Cu2+-exporting ATPase